MSAQTIASINVDPPYTAADWPIGAAVLQFPAVTRHGLHTQTAGREEWRRVFSEIAAAGFDHVDLTDSWLRPGDLDQPGRRELAAALADTRLGVTAVSTIRQSVIDPDPDLAANNLAYTLRSVEAAADIGTSILSVGLHRALTDSQTTALWFWHEPGATDPFGDEATWTLAVERLQQVGRRAAELGIEVSLEMYEDTYLGTADSAVALKKAIDLPNVGLNPDSGNLVRLHRPIEDWVEVWTKTLPHANYWHMKNYYRDYDPATGAYFSSPAPMESGIMNYRLGLEIALEAGYSGPLCVEHYGGDGLSVAAANRDYIRRVLASKLRPSKKTSTDAADNTIETPKESTR